MERVALVRLKKAAEKKVCMDVAGLPAAVVCHPLNGIFDLLVVFNGTPEEIEESMNELWGLEDVADVSARDKKELDFIRPGEKAPEEAEFDFKRGPGGFPFILCPRCGNESFAYCQDCGSTMFPGHECGQCTSGQYFCSVCGHEMRAVD